MKLKKTEVRFDTPYAGFRSVVPPTSETLSDYVRPPPVGTDGSVANAEFIRHKRYACERDFIVRSYRAWIATFAGVKRDLAKREAEKVLREFDELSLHRLFTERQAQ